jgi:hypothetical protein
MKRKMVDGSLGTKQELDVDSKMNAVNGLHNKESTDVRSVLIVGAGPAGLMLAYVYPTFPFPFLFIFTETPPFQCHSIRTV